MRIIVNIDDDVLASVRYLAAQEKVSLGVMLSDLARKGLKTVTLEFGSRAGFPTFHVPDNAAPITPEQVRILDDEA